MPTRYAYLLGMPRSGTTLMSILLSSHPEIATIGDAKEAPRLVSEKPHQSCSCGLAFRDDPFWQRVASRMTESGVSLEGEYFVRGEADDPRAKRLRSALVGAVMTEQGGSVFFDTSRHPGFVRPLLDHDDFDLRVIDWYRDGRGVLASWRRSLPDIPTEEHARRWVQREGLRQKMLELIPPDRRIVVHYETLCAEPRRVLQQIAGFIGVDPTVDLMGRIGGDHHVVGNKIRLEPVTEVRLDERWRTELGPAELSIFADAGGHEVNRRNGYKD